MTEMIKNPKRYACMPKLKKTRAPSYLDPYSTEYNTEIECYVPVVCYVVADKTNYMPDGTIQYNCEIAYTRNQWNLQSLTNPLEENKNVIVTQPMDEVSEDYEIIKALCTQKNRKLLQNLGTTDYQEWNERKIHFLHNEIAYFSECYEPLNKAIVKELKKS